MLNSKSMMYSREKTIEQIKNLNAIRSSYYKPSSEFKANDENASSALFQEKAVHIEYNINEYYEGEINKEFTPHGQGCLQYANGDYYVGDFNNGVKEGLGQYYYQVDSITYIGFWKKDVKEGDGTVSNMKQQWEFIGKFLNDKPIEGYLDIYTHNNDIEEEIENKELCAQIKNVRLKEIDYGTAYDGDIIGSNEKVNINALRSPKANSIIKKRKRFSTKLKPSK